MGGSVGSFSYTPNSDSLACPGEKSVLSDPIDGVTADKLFEGVEKYIRGGKTKAGKETEFDLTEKDGAVHIKQVFNIPEIFGGGTHTVFQIYKFDAAKLSIEHQFFAGPKIFESGTPNTTNRSVIHADPCRVEFWQEAHEVRASGPMLKGMMEKVLSMMGSKAKAHCDQSSIAVAGKNSVTSDPIDDVSVTADSYLDFFKGFLTETMQATELPDGTIIEERSAMMDVLGIGTKSFAKHVIKMDENHLYCYEYGEDESLTEMVGVTHVQVHKEPFRLEQWNIQSPGRRAGPSHAGIVKPFIDSILKFLSESS